MKHLLGASGTSLFPVVLPSSLDPTLPHLTLNSTLINWLWEFAPWVLLLSCISSSSLVVLISLCMYMSSKHRSPRMIVLLSSGLWYIHLAINWEFLHKHFLYWILDLPSSLTNYHSPMFVIIKHATVHVSYPIQKPNALINLRHFTLVNLPCIHFPSCCQATISSQQL